MRFLSVKRAIGVQFNGFVGLFWEPKLFLIKICQPAAGSVFATAICILHDLWLLLFQLCTVEV